MLACRGGYDSVAIVVSRQPRLVDSGRFCGRCTQKLLVHWPVAGQRQNCPSQPECRVVGLYPFVKAGLSVWGLVLLMRQGSLWGSGLVEGAVAEHGEQDADALAGEAGESLVGLFPRARCMS